MENNPENNLPPNVPEGYRLPTSFEWNGHEWASVTDTMPIAQMYVYLFGTVGVMAQDAQALALNGGVFTVTREHSEDTYYVHVSELESWRRLFRRID